MGDGGDGGGAGFEGSGVGGSLAKLFAEGAQFASGGRKAIDPITQSSDLVGDEGEVDAQHNAAPLLLTLWGQDRQARYSATRIWFVLA